MATYINNNVKFHAFSKSPVSPDTTLGGAVNPSGHTITTSQVRAQDIPAFLNTFQGTKDTAITWLGKNYATPAHNDIAYYGGEFKAGFDTPKCLKYNGKTSTWEDFDLKYTDRQNKVLRTTLKNADDKDVLAIHQDCSTVFVDGGNNAATNSNRWSLFVKKADGSILDHFVASTDKIVAGMPSLGYNALVMLNNAAIDEGELDANYVGNTFAGIIHLNKQYANGDDAKFKVTCFEYIGDKLDTTLGNIREEIQDIVGVTIEGVVASVGTNDAATNAGIGVDSTTKTSPKITFTAGSVATGETKLVSGGAVKTYVDSATAKATVSAQGVVTTGDEAKLVTATGAQNIATKAASDAISGLDSSVARTKNNGYLYINITDGKLTDADVRVASVSDQGEIIGESSYFVTAADAVKIATKAANDLEIPEVADATTTSKGIVQLSAAEIGGTETSDTLVPTVGAVAKSVKTLQGQIETIAGAGLNYHVLGTSEELPAPAETYKGIVYLKKNTESEAGEYIEYLCVYDGTAWKWEQIGSTKTDLTGYVKTIKVNERSKSVDSNTTEINLGSVITGFYATEASGGINKVANSASMRALVDSDGTVDIGVIDATSTDKGLVTLTSTYSATDEASAVTGKAVASAISGIDKGVTGITVNGGSKQTGDVTLNVVTGFSNSANSGNSDPDAINVANFTNGTYGLYAVIADDTHRGVTYLYDKTATGLGSSTTATVSEKTVKSVYDTLYNKIPTKYVSSVNGISGPVTLKAGGNSGNVTVNTTSGSASNLWGLNVDNRNGGYQYVIDGFIGDSNVYGNIGTDYAATASLPAEATKVIGNFVYGSDGKVIDTIRAERMVSDFYGKTATGLTEWVADMPNLKNGNECFRQAQNLTTFIGDLSSLENGDYMFYECTALSEFIGDLSSLSNGFRMFSDKNGSTFTSTKLNSESVECILESIPDWTGDDEEHHLDIGVSTVITAESDVRQSVKDITGVELTATNGNAQEITYKGWTITFFVAE